MTDKADDQQTIKNTLPTSKSGGLYNWVKRIFHFIFDVVTNFVDDDCYTKASALAFYSLLSIVPILAVLFGMAKGFGFGEALESEISTQIFQQPEISTKLIQFAHSSLQNLKGGVIAGLGTIILLWSVISLLISVENSLNAIWKIKTGRSYAYKIRDYLTVLFIAPLFFVASSSINIYLITQITETAQNNEFVEAVSPFLLFALHLFPFFLIWILFSFIYVFIPNRKVNLREAIIAGVIAGTAFQFWQWIYIHFQVRLSTYGAIYGSFAALPLFLIWLQVSWLIVLAGAEIAVEIENAFIIRDGKSHLLSIKTVALLIVYNCVLAFAKGAPPLTDLQLACKLGISLSHFHEILEVLSVNRIISEVSVGNNTFGYQPARAIQDITIQVVFDAFDKSYEIPACVQDTIELQKIERLITEMDKVAADSLGNKSLYSLVSL